MSLRLQSTLGEWFADSFQAQGYREMNKRILMLMLTVAAATLAGCTAVGPRFERETEPTVADGRALVYVYRLDKNALGARTASIAIDGKRVGGLKKGGYLAVKLDPGTYSMTQNWDSWIGDFGYLDKPISVKISLAPGTVTYWRLDTGAAPGPYQYQTISMTLLWELRNVPASTALSDLTLLNRVPITPPFSNR
jgi:hypothetical protein